MKYLYVFCLFAALSACSDDLKVEKKVFTPDQETAVDSRLSDMYEKIALCDALAKCLGYESGRIQTHSNPVFLYNQGQQIAYEAQMHFGCVARKISKEKVAHRTVDSGSNLGGHTYKVSLDKWETKVIDLADIATMYEGCTGKVCTPGDCKK